MTDTVNVPRDPTLGMIHAAERVGSSLAGSDASSGEITAAVWAAMLAAAPKSEPVSGDWYSAESIDALVREIDVALNGANAAPQAKLCDLVKQIKELAQPEARDDDWTPFELKPNDIANIIDRHADCGDDGLQNASQLAELIYQAGRRYGTHPAPASDELLEALKGARWYVADHQEAQPNDETNSLLGQIDALLAKHKGPQS